MVSTIVAWGHVDLVAWLRRCACILVVTEHSCLWMAYSVSGSPGAGCDWFLKWWFMAMVTAFAKFFSDVVCPPLLYLV